MNRRDLLATLPALAVAAPSAAIAKEPETEIMRLFREWKAAVQRSENMDVTSDKLFDEVTEIEKAILDTPCRSARDFVAKVASWTNFGEIDFPSKSLSPDFWDEARGLIEVRA